MSYEVSDNLQWTIAGVHPQIPKSNFSVFLFALRASMGNFFIERLMG
jgi:hypothetical protein